MRLIMHPLNHSHKNRMQKNAVTGRDTHNRKLEDINATQRRIWITSVREFSHEGQNQGLSCLQGPKGSPVSLSIRRFEGLGVLMREVSNGR